MRVRSLWLVLLAFALMMIGLAVPTPSSAADSEIVVRARGRLGTEKIDLLVNYEVVASWNLVNTDFEEFSYTAPAGVGINQLLVRHDSGGWPNAVIVDWVSVNGQRYDSSDPLTLSSGSWDRGTGCASGYKQSDWLSCNNSWFQYNVGGNDKFLSVTALGHLGTENIDLVIDGEEVASWDLSKSYQTFYYPLAPGQVIEQVQLHNDNGGWPNAVIVHDITYDGVIYHASRWRTLSSGSWTAAHGCSEGVRLSGWLSCNNSWFDFGINPRTPKYRTIEVVAKGHLGTETLDLIVNGLSWSQPIELSTSFESFDYLYSPTDPVETIEIRSQNGGWPAAVIVDYIVVDGYKIDTSDGRTLSSGSWDPANGCSEGNKRSDWLSCSNSWFKYDLRSARDPLE